MPVESCRKIGTDLGKKGHKHFELQRFPLDSRFNLPIDQAFINGLYFDKYS